MRAKRRVCLYGNSVIMGTLGASLRRYPGLEVTTLLPSATETGALAALEPDVVIFDLDADRPEEAFSLLESSPSLLLIGVSPDVNQVKVWSGQQLRQLSTEDLLGMIDEQLKNAPAESRDSNAPVQ